MDKIVAPSSKFPGLLRWLRDSARTHISLPLFTLVLLALIGMTTAHLIDSERAAAVGAARASSAELAEAYGAHVQRSLGTIERALKTLKYAVGLRGHTGALPDLNQQGLTPSGLFFTVSIVDVNGIVVASNSGQEYSDLSNHAAFLYHRGQDNKLTYVDRVREGSLEGEWLLGFSRRLNDADGDFAGAVMVAVDPAYLASFEHHRLGKLGALGIVGSDGILRAWSVGASVSWGQRAPNAAELGAAASADGAAARPWTSSWDGQARFVSLHALSNMPLTALVGLAEEEQLAPFERRRTNLLWIAASISGTLVLIVALLCIWSFQITRTRERARRAEETYAAASKASMDAFFVLRSIRDGSGAIVEFRVEEVNLQAERMLFARREQLIGCRFTDILPEVRSSGIFDELVAVATGGGVQECEWYWSGAEDIGVANGSRWMHRQVVAVEDGVVAIVRDITERKQAEERIRHLAHHDELTGLANRVLVRDRLEQALRQAERRARSVALVFIDLDGFKAVNDNLGHDAGDALLKEVGARMAACLRREDTLGRFGGDEFVIVLADQGADALVLLPLLEKIRLQVNQPITLPGGEVKVGCSMGVAMYPANGLDPTELMKHADAAMYRAKGLGKNNVQLYTPDPAPASAAA